MNENYHNIFYCYSFEGVNLNGRLKIRNKFDDSVMKFEEANHLCITCRINRSCNIKSFEIYSSFKAVFLLREKRI